MPDSLLPAAPSSVATRRQRVQHLVKLIRQVETGETLDRRETESEQTATLRLPARAEDSPFQRVLPAPGLPRGGLLELLVEGPGGGGLALALHLAIPLLERRHGGMVLIDSDHELYPPALAGLGLDLARTIVIRPQSLREGTWAFEQALRSPGVAAVWCRNLQWNSRVFRRLQLAAEAGGGLGLVSSPATSRRQPSWAEVRWLLRPLAGGRSQSSGRRLQIELLQVRGGTGGGVVELEICDETGAVRLVPPVAAAETVARTPRA